MVRLVPMNEDELQAFLEVLIPHYAREKVESGVWRDDLSRHGYHHEKIFVTFPADPGKKRRGR